MFKIFSKNKKRIVRSAPSATNNQRIIAGKKKQRTAGGGRSMLVKILMRLLVMVFVGVTIYILFFSPLLAIESVEVSNTENIDNQKVLEIIHENMDGKYAGIFMKNNLILFNRDNIKTKLKDDFRRIKTIEIVKKFPSKLLVRIQEYESALVFCSGDQCLVIDNEGEAYAQADFQSGELGENELIILKDNSQKMIEKEDFSMDVGLIKFVSEIRNRLKRELDIDLKQECQTSMLVSGDLQFETVSGYRIYTSYKLGANKTIEMLKTALNNVINKEVVADLEYVDLRLDNKVYYKLKQQNITPESEVVVEKNEEKKTKKK